MSQLFFDFYRTNSNNLENYSDFIINTDNQIAHSNVKKFFEFTNFTHHPFKNLILQGEACCGKTHLLKFLTRQYASQSVINFINPQIINDGNESSINFLDYFQKDQFYIIDDLNNIINEANLLHLINCAHEAQAMLLLTWRLNKVFNIKDLNSRLKNFNIAQINPTSIHNLKIIFANILARHQLNLESTIIDYIFEKITPKYSEIVYAVKKIEFYCGENSQKISLTTIKKIF